MKLIVGRRPRAPRLEMERARRCLAARLFGVIEAPPVIGPYAIVERIGAGGQGDVYLVEDPRLGRRLAVKVLRHPLGPDGVIEARALAQIEHPAIVRVYDVGTTSSGPEDDLRGFLAMEHVPGDPLDVWADATPDWSVCVRVVLEAGHGLAAAHAQGIVHGDFKPANVLVDRDNRPRVMDFGLARWCGASRSSSDAHETVTRGGGTLGYRAPECDVAAADARSDQYSFGVTAQRILLGSSTRPPPSNRVRRRVEAVLARARRDDPNARWPNLPTLLARLDAASRPSRHGLVAAAVMVAGALGAWMMTHSRGESPAEPVAKAEGLLHSVTARVDYEKALADRDAGHVVQARTTLEQVVLDARAHGDDRLAAEAAVELVALLAEDQGAFEAAQRWEPHARAALQRLADPGLQARFDVRWARLLVQAGRTDEARDRLEAIAVGLDGAAEPFAPARVDVYTALADLETATGNAAAGLHWAKRAVAITETKEGGRSHTHGRALHLLGIAQQQGGDLVAARGSFEAAAVMMVDASDLDRRLIHNSLGIVLDLLGELDEARRQYELALEAADPTRDHLVAGIRTNLGWLELERDDADAALVQFSAARTAAEAALLAENPIHQRIAFGLGQAHARRGDAVEAVWHIEHALQLLLEGDWSEASQGRFRSALGQARWGLPDDRARARREVERGLAQMRTNPAYYAEPIADAEAWLVDHTVDGTHARAKGSRSAARTRR